MKREKEGELFLALKCQLNKYSEDDEDRKSLFDDHHGGGYLKQELLMQAKAGEWRFVEVQVLVSLQYLAIKYLSITKIKALALEWRNLAESNLTRGSRSGITRG